MTGSTMMKCPSCQAVLARSSRHEVEIDTCPDCRGVWLDRGELDKILRQEAAVPDSPPRDTSRLTPRLKGRRSTWRELFE